MGLTVPATILVLDGYQFIPTGRAGLTEIVSGLVEVLAAPVMVPVMVSKFLYTAVPPNALTGVNVIACPAVTCCSVISVLAVTVGIPGTTVHGCVVSDFGTTVPQNPLCPAGCDR